MSEHVYMLFPKNPTRVLKLTQMLENAWKIHNIKNPLSCNVLFFLFQIVNYYKLSSLKNTDLLSCNFYSQGLNTFNLDLLCLWSRQAEMKVSVDYISTKWSSRKRPNAGLLQRTGSINFLVAIGSTGLLLGADQGSLFTPTCCSQVFVMWFLLSQQQRTSLSHFISPWLPFCDQIFLLLPLSSNQNWILPTHSGEGNLF